MATQPYPISICRTNTEMTRAQKRSRASIPVKINEGQTNINTNKQQQQVAKSQRNDEVKSTSNFFELMSTFDGLNG
eukprot:7020090-Ditylum_brightwellii.AAC.1